MTVVGGTTLKHTGSGPRRRTASETTWNDGVALTTASLRDGPTECKSVGGWWVLHGVHVHPRLPARKRALRESRCPNPADADLPERRESVERRGCLEPAAGADDFRRCRWSQTTCSSMPPILSRCVEPHFAHRVGLVDPIQTCGQAHQRGRAALGRHRRAHQPTVRVRAPRVCEPQLYVPGGQPGSAPRTSMTSQTAATTLTLSADGVAGTGGYHAVPGYDLATGLGSPQCALLTTLATTCVPTTTRCTSGTEQETCTVGGQWGAPETCATRAHVRARTCTDLRAGIVAVCPQWRHMRRRRGYVQSEQDVRCEWRRLGDRLRRAKDPAISGWGASRSARQAARLT